MLRFVLLTLFAAPAFIDAARLNQRAKAEAWRVNNVENDRSNLRGNEECQVLKQGRKPKPLDEICAEIECPAFDPVNGTGCGYTARILHESVWVGTPLRDYEDPSSYTESFWRLFNYINGSNVDQAKINMTVPVIYLFFMDVPTLKITSSYMYFYLPAAFQGAPPQPTGEDVKLTTFAKQYVYSRAMGGNSPSKEQWRKNFEDLYQAMLMDGIVPDVSCFATAGYTRPYFGRQRQEAMYFAPIKV